MGEPQSPERAGLNGRDSALLAVKINRGTAVTTIVQRTILPFLLKAASATGFKVEEIAKEGETFPYGGRVSRVGVGEINLVAVSIEKPKGIRGIISRGQDFSSFWNKVDDLELEQV